MTLRRATPWFPLCLLLLGVAQADDREYLLEGTDRRYGTFNGQLLLKVNSRNKVEAVRSIFYQQQGHERLSGQGTLKYSVLDVRFPIQEGMVGRLSGRSAGALRLLADVWDKGAELSTECRQRNRLRSAGTGILVETHPTNALSNAKRRPKLMEASHKYVRFEGVPYVRGAGDAHDVNVNDVAQGGLGDCYFMAGLAAVAYTDPHRIRSMIRTEEDGTFSVYLFRHNDQWEEVTYDADGTYIPTVKATRIAVDDRFPSDAAGKSPVYAWFGDEIEIDGKKVRELWPMILEKAWAQHRRSYAAIEGGWASTPMSFFSAKEVWDGDPRALSDSELLQKLKAADQRHWPVTMGVPEPGGNHDLNVHSDHYYTFIGIEGNDRIRVYNPWGEDHPTRALTAAEFKQVFDTMHVGRF